MRYIIYGAGAIGGSIGGLLHRAGFETVLICRGAQLEAIRERGLTIRTPSGPLHASVPVAGHPRELAFRQGDVVVLAMKSQDTEQALLDLEAAGGGDLPVVCCQNGIDNERMVARRFAHVYAMLVATPANYLEAGVVVSFGSPIAGVLDAGRFPSGVDALIEQVAADITAAGFSSRAIPNIMRYKNTKLLHNLANAISALVSTPRRDPRVREVEHALRMEGAACFRAAGIDFASDEEYESVVSVRYQGGEVPGEQRGGTSTWQSLMRGLPTVEVDYLNGEFVLLGNRYGVPTPYNTTIRRLVQQLATSGRAPRGLTIDDLLECLPLAAAD